MGDAPVIAPVLTYTVLPGEHDVHAVFKALTELADEDPMLGVSWNTHLEQIHLQLMGAVQLEVVQRVLADRFGLSVAFESGGILYKETISQPVEAWAILSRCATMPRYICAWSRCQRVRACSLAP